MRDINLSATRTLAIVFWSELARPRWVGGGVQPATTVRTTHRAATEAAVRKLRQAGVAAFSQPIGAAMPEGPPMAWHFDAIGRTNTQD